MGVSAFATGSEPQPGGASVELVRLGRMIMAAIRRGLLTGLFAGLGLAMLHVVVGGAPGNGLPDVLRWFGLTFAVAVISRLARFLLLTVLRGVFALPLHLIL